MSLEGGRELEVKVRRRKLRAGNKKVERDEKWQGKQAEI